MSLIQHLAKIAATAANQDAHVALGKKVPNTEAQNYRKLTKRVPAEFRDLRDEMADWIDRSEENSQLDKQAIHVEEGGPISRVTASTLGRINPDSLVSLLLTRHALTDPSRDLNFKRNDEKVKRHERTANLMASYAPEALKDTVLRLGGTDLVDDLLYAKNRGEDKPWHSRVGGRVWHNPKTSLAGKVLGTLSVPYTHGLSNLMRSSNYSPYTDVATVYANDDPLVEHELGHALDFNQLYGINPGKSKGGIWNRLKQELKGGARDAYMLGYARFPLFRLLAEARANTESQKALNYALRDNPEELRERNARRMEVLPAGYGTYLGAAIPGVGAPVGGLIGKAIGLRAGQAYRRLNEANPTLKAASAVAQALNKAASYRGVALGGLGGAGLGYLQANRHNSRLLGTAKVLRDYGLLKPKLLRSALPLLVNQ